MRWTVKSKVKFSIPFIYSFSPSPYVRIYNALDVVPNLFNRYLVYPPIVPNIFLGNEDIAVEQINRSRHHGAYRLWLVKINRREINCVCMSIWQKIKGEQREQFFRRNELI